MFYNLMQTLKLFFYYSTTPLGFCKIANFFIAKSRKTRNRIHENLSKYFAKCLVRRWIFYPNNSEKLIRGILFLFKR